ncbi:MAG: alpha/beta fold hydrolase [Pseudomonadales bacterium]|nr:alpha/beta fold hydrolase [Pseudomonadales bacterium]
MQNADDLLECVEVNPPEKPNSCVIWLHGLGADGHDFEAIVPELDVSDLNIRFVFPHAPIRPVTINAGMEMRAWYDIEPDSQFGASTSEDQDIQNSVAQVSALIERELGNGISADKIVLAGFSQGGVIALELALAYDKKLAGIMALSTYIHDHEHIAERIQLANTDTPIFMAHGRMDPMIPITRALTAKAKLIELNYAVEWHEYAMGHELCLNQIMDISKWLSTNLPKT